MCIRDRARLADKRSARNGAESFLRKNNTGIDDGVDERKFDRRRGSFLGPTSASALGVVNLSLIHI